MSRLTVRLAAAAYLRAQSIAGLVNVYDAMPRAEDAWDGASPGMATTCVAFPVIASQSEARIGMGRKQITYTMTLEFACFSAQPKGEDAQSDADDIFEAILAVIRQDQTLGTAGSGSPIFQAGEGDGTATPDLRLDQDLPVQAEEAGGAIQIWARLLVTAIEIIVA